MYKKVIGFYCEFIKSTTSLLTSYLLLYVRQYLQDGEIPSFIGYFLYSFFPGHSRIHNKLSVLLV